MCEDKYQVITIPRQRMVKENRGARKKYWVFLPGEVKENATGNWLFKIPRVNSDGTVGGHWAEKVVFEVASYLGIQHAKVELAEWEGKFGKRQAETTKAGTICKSFIAGSTDRKRFSTGKVFLTGMSVAENGQFSDIGQHEHSVNRILNAFNEDEKIINKNKTKRQFIGYLLLDLIVLNTDRHYENWGILKTRKSGNKYLAPLYDCASSLGANSPGEAKARYLKQGVAEHIKRKRSKIYLGEKNGNAAPHVDLVKEFCQKSGVKINEIVSRCQLESLADEKIHEIIKKIPENWMSADDREFAEAVVKYNIEEQIFGKLASHFSKT